MARRQSLSFSTGFVIPFCVDAGNGEFWFTNLDPGTHTADGEFWFENLIPNTVYSCPYPLCGGHWLGLPTMKAAIAIPNLIEARKGANE